jgi:hypothetical protein
MANKKTAVDGGVEVRLLQDCEYGKCNDVVTIPADELNVGLFHGNVDPDATAVAYAKTLVQNGGTEV